ncbi:E3 ubiquitin-protein ligase SIAH2 [Orchesella cincta]|uniref:RING-type E3 ubiquitin transferase n=1 Tax=Orchesella cincta TaxID=48709 RepID=A0A1D2MQI2_ORCCI|nr:E3 ubiquitin-protein ligase SIAH2 [Orchesella cincta]
MEMEAFRSCPICLEVPAAEIYQCFAGHYICNVCITKVSGDLCPQCRAPFGSPKIRNRVLEQLLDGQEFGCKFSEQGCTHLSKRGELANHSDSCFYRPLQVPICRLLGYDKCDFKVGALLGSQIGSHFMQKHKTVLQRVPVLELRVNQDKLMSMLNNKRKRGEHYNFQPSLITLEGTKPVFLIQMKVDRSAGFLSFVVIKIWECESHPVKNFNVKLTVNKEIVSASNSNSAQGTSSSAISAPNLFPISWKLKVYSLKEAQYVLQVLPINIPIPMLGPGCFVDLMIYPDK